MSTKPRKRKDKEANTSYDEPKRHMVLSGKRNIVGVEDKTDMSEDYEKFHEIAPFTVNVDPSIKFYTQRDTREEKVLYPKIPLWDVTGFSS